ncbi:CAZyme family GH18 [Aspergillus niger]|nr:CAZyme family GH18 [Aspergillus niger]
MNSLTWPLLFICLILLQLPSAIAQGPECGEFAAPGNSDCPINVCCSSFGYCGVTSEFCGNGCQKNSNGGGCGQPNRPKCSENTDAMTYDRRIGYYELFNIHKGCNVIEPESLIIEPFTHINLAFVNFGDDFKLEDEYGDIVDRVSFLKFTHPGLRVNIAVGGWTFSDAPTQHLWTQMARSYENRQTFINSVVKYLKDYHLDGIDIDWEYPSASDRGGEPQDAANFVTLLGELREAFDRENPGWEISATLPTSYWYLRGFDPAGMAKYVDYFNLMSYDLHGMWDQDITWTGPYLKGHTNITEIDLGLDLLWRNDVDPSKVVFGFAFYGRSFTMADPNCYQPNGKCEFSDGGIPGSCSDTSGILTYAEVASRNNSLDVHTFYDPETTVKYNVYKGTQWISYDDEQSFFDKKKFISSRCLSGWMIWAIDQDDGDFDALAGVIGEDLSVMQMEGGGLSGDAANALADAFAAYTGQNCFVTPRCTDGSSGEKNPDQVCPSGYMSVSTAHNPLQAGNKELHGDCSEGWYRHICCPEDAMPKNCEWNGAPERSEFGCDGKCGKNQFKLNQDTALDAEGEGQCFIGERYLCCDSAAMFSDCKWTDCQGPLLPYTPGECPADNDALTFRWDKPDGKPWCSDTYVSSVDGSVGSPLHDRFKSELCCPSDHSFSVSGCAWTNTITEADMKDDDWAEHITDLVCKPRPCSPGKVKVAGALDPPPAMGAGSKSEINCDGVTIPPGSDPEWSFCCDPPSRYDKNWPVDPKYLWEKYYNDPKKSDVVWEYSDEYQNNNMDSEPSTEEDGSDAYGFVMLDGPDGSIDNDFATSHTVVRRSREIPRVKRSVLTTNQTLMDTVFDHAEETFHVYCNYPAESHECERVFIDGAEDTIIRLPDHVGEGPFARIVSMKAAHDEYQLPDHHLEHRSLERNTNPVYEVKIDYNFHLIKLKRDDEPVNIRVDYTNLMGYWDEMTNSPAIRTKRGLGEEGLTEDEWRSRVQRAIVRHSNIEKRNENIHVKTPMEFTGSHLDKRWWGAFKAWLQKLTTVTKSSLGVIELGFSKTINLFWAQWGCPGQTFSANLRMDLEADLVMDATYAYYLSATFIPPGKPETFAYFGMNPTAYLGLHIEGNAQMQTTTDRKKIIDTLSYPGLAVKGIAAVGPTLDIYGEIRGKITLHGEATAGAQLFFGKAEVYWPQNDDAKDKYETLLGLQSDVQAPAPGSVEPVFEAGVALDAQLDIIVTPEAHVGIKIGGGKLVGGATLMDAQLTGYVIGDLSFQAHGDYDTTGNEFNYRFGVYLFYNLGYKATAQILNFIDWALAPRMAYDPRKTFKLYEKKGSIPMSSSAKSKREATIDGPLHQDLVEVGSLTNGSISTYLDSASGLSRRGDEMDIDGPNAPEFTQNLKCPPGTSGDVQLPEIRFNCDFLNDFIEQSKNGKMDAITGLCTPVLNIPDNKRQKLFTFSNDEARKDARYNAQCPAGTCKQVTTDLKTHQANKNLELQCDEFPWKSSEQGGDYLASDARTGTCVASYQNNWHGQCLRMIGDMESNWAKLEPERKDGDDRGDYWLSWRSGVWTKPGQHGPQGSQYEQRLKEYPEKQPMPDGVPTRSNDKISWVFKRDYEVSFIRQDPSTIDGSTWWGATSHKFKTKTNSGPSGMDAILCAINHFGQDSVYKLPVGYNGYCRRNNGSPIKGWSAGFNMGKCEVKFANPNSSNKRSIGTFAGWEVESVRMLDEDDYE